MNGLDRLETLAQQLIEGIFQRLFQTQLHPADLARHLAAVIETGRQAGAPANVIPNHYWIRLNPADYAGLINRSSEGVEIAHLRNYLAHLIEEAGYQLTGPLQISLDQSATVLPGQVEIMTNQAPSLARESDIDLHETQQVAIVAALHPAKQWLLQLEERPIRLGEPVVNIGRALDNDIILRDPTVSRYHAQLRWREGCYHLCPPHFPINHATQGVMIDSEKTKALSPPMTVNHKPVIQHPLAAGDIIGLGNTTLTVIVEVFQ